MKKLILTLLVCFLIVTAAGAEEPEFYAGVNLRPINGMYQNFHLLNNSMFVGLKSDNLRFELNPRLYYSVQENKNTLGTKTESTDTFFGFGGSIIYDFEKSGFITPFVGLDVSFGIGSNVVKNKTTGVKTTDNDLMGYSLGVQGGISLSFSESWNFDLALGFNYIGTQVDPMTGGKITSKGYAFDLVGMRLRYSF